MKQWLLKWVSIILLGALIYMAHERRPLLETHQARLYQATTGEEATADVLTNSAWNDLQLRDFFILTATQDGSKNTLVSFGFGNYIKILDEEWVAKAFQLTSR